MQWLQNPNQSNVDVVYIDDVNILGLSVHAIKKNTEA
jgi:hypothetical protein